MSMFETPEVYKGPIDPDGGFLCFVTCWRPQAGEDDADAPGEKRPMSSYIPVAPDHPCLCGSGKTFAACCQPKRLWYMVCPNPGIPGEAGPQSDESAVGHISQRGRGVRAPASMDDIRLRGDTPERAFWIYEGDPAIQTPQGIMCFGDIELQHNHTLFVTAMSDVRMRILLNLLREDCGRWIGQPRIKYDVMRVIDKRTGKLVIRQPEAPLAARRRRKR